MKEAQVPEWEHITAARQQDATGEKATRPAGLPLSARFDAVMPAHGRYLGMKRRTFLIALGAGGLALLALVIGLAVGLSHKSTQNLPLPSNTNTFTGELTYYAPGLGACGITSSESDKIVAVSHLLFDAAGSTSSNGGNSNSNPLCGKMIRAQRYDEQAGGMRSVDLKVVDRCTGCAANDLDVTEDVFGKLASVDQGRVDVKWAWLR
ncbi:expansin-related protein [Dothistroma septosporum NZE10]|uniref:Expansin-related protein n=1 Tax=Dothistroma septosporum (strain NZE10 / CBS 128990) TaxID=675120 RepID=N1PL14_DOTSN|nr:expansin-related protein [Dothistroma septosporum NZE10]